jgi:drug/metabolite transporter (DMT)-like permease
VATLPALGAALAFALGCVLQQRGTLEASPSSEGGGWLLEILHKPVWVAGAVLMATGWVLQARALDQGPLVVVQSLTTLSLVIALPFGAWLTHQRITRSVVIGAVAVVVGIVLFLTVGSPSGGTSSPGPDEWWPACIVTAVLVVSFAWYGRRFSGARRAFLFGAAAGFGYALQSAVTKVFVTQIGGGLAAILADWAVYVLVASAISGFVLQQSALKTGVLATAMASSNTVTLFAGVVLGITVFGETLQRGAGRLVPAILGLGLTLFGVSLLAGAPPPEAAPPEGEVGSRGPGRSAPASGT